MLYAIGTVVSKKFDGKAYSGEIVSYDEKREVYSISYEDGDEEEMYEEEIGDYIVYEVVSDQDEADDQNEAGQQIANETETANTAAKPTKQSLSFLRVLIGAFVAWILAIAVVVISDEAPSHHAESLPDYLQPFRPVGIKVINAIGIILAEVGLIDKVMSLDPDYLIRSACSRLGQAHPRTHCVLLDEDKYWHASFHRLTGSLQEAKLTMLGRIIAQGQVLGMLETRGRLLEAFDSEPEAAAAPISDPVFVVGLPRSGTTFLSRLLAIDPGNRGPTLWEYMDPVPRPPSPPPSNASKANIESYEIKTKKRIAEQQWKLDQYKSLAPGVDSMHPLEATNPEECIIIMNYAMDSEQVAVTYPIHEYMTWLLGFDHHKDVLRWNKRVLQHLQYADPYGPRRWVVKTPYYLTMLDDIRSVYPNAKIIHTHRDPAESILSVSSVISKLQGIVTDDIDLQRIGAQQKAIHETMVEKALQVRKKWAEENIGANSNSEFRVVDVHLKDLQRSPVKTVKMIYKALFDTALAPETALMMQGWLKQNPRTKHGTHEPTMSEFGLENIMKSKVFSEYVDVFGAKGAASLSKEQEQQKMLNHEAELAQGEL